MPGGQGRQIIKMFPYVLNSPYKGNSHFPNHLFVNLDFLYKQFGDNLSPSFSLTFWKML